MRGIGLAVVIVLVSVAGEAFADDSSRGEFAVGWRSYHALISSVVVPVQQPRPDDYPKGWFADVAAHVSPIFAVVGEAGGTYRRKRTVTTSGVVSSTEELSDITFYTFMGGVRVRAPQYPALVPFGQVLFGGEHDSSVADRTLTIGGNVFPTHQERRTSSAVLALDAGITAATHVIGVRVSTGYQRFFSQADADAFRVNVGAVVRF